MTAGNAMDDLEKTLISVTTGAVLGAIIAYVPRFLANRQKLVSNRALLCCEIDTCRERAQEYIKDRITSPTNRLPSAGWSHSVPLILSITTVENINDIQLYYLEVDALNRGLDLAEKYINDENQLAREYKRNLLKANNIIEKRYEKARLAAESITRWPWAS